MLFIQSNNNQELSKLSEEFDRDGNLFGVPFRQSHRIKDIVQQIKYQVFQGYFQPGKLQNKKGVIQMKQLAVKIEKFLLCMLNLKFSLPTLREIFELIKSQQAKYTFYCNYYEQMSRVIEQETDQQDHKQKYRILELNVQSEEEEAYNNLNVKSKQILQTYQSSFDFIQHHQNSGRQSEANVEKIDWELIRSLKSQLPNSPKYVFSAIPDLSVFKTKEQDQQMTSFQVQNTCHKIRDFDALLSTEGSQKKTTNNEYLDSLSGRVHPLPSFLHDENMGQMIAKQKKEDIRKSKILRQAINKQDSSTSTTSNPRGYSASLRAIKLNNKLRKNSRNSISIKDELHREESKKSLYSNTTDCKFFNKASHTSEKELNEKIIKAVEEKQKQMFASQKKCKEGVKKCGNFIKSKVIK